MNQSSTLIVKVAWSITLLSTICTLACGSIPELTSICMAAMVHLRLTPQEITGIATIAALTRSLVIMIEASIFTSEKHTSMMMMKESLLLNINMFTSHISSVIFQENVVSSQKRNQMEKEGNQKRVKTITLVKVAILKGEVLTLMTQK